MKSPDQNGHSINDHTGILAVAASGEGERVEITFDAEKLSEADVRKIALEHIQPAGNLQRRTLRLDGHACEAAAAKLEARVERVPGVRKATATYIGRVLCLTFDPKIADECSVMEGVRGAGADVKPLKAAREASLSLTQKFLKGELNEEASCLAGLLFLVASAIADHFTGRGVLTSVLYLGAYIFAGQYGVRSAIASLRERTLDVDVLMVLAALGAAVVGAPFEGALLLFLFSFSNVLQSHAMERTQRAIESLLTLRPDKALRKHGDSTELVAIDDINPGDIVIVRPGELIPIDGTVAEGTSHVNESSLTGESMPVEKSVGAPVYAGTLNQSGGLEVAVVKKAADSTLSKMVKLVAEAQAQKSRTQRFLEKAEQGYAAGVIAFTVLVLVVPWLLWGEGFSTAFYRAMTVMVVASPCALVISTPATVLSAIGGAARRGILIKGGSHLETAARIDIVCFDKTGTLTAGKPAVTDVITQAGMDAAGSIREASRMALRIAAAIEERSEHPLASAIVGAAKESGIDVPSATAFQSSPGKGAEAQVDGLTYIVGSERFFREAGARGLDKLFTNVSMLQTAGKTCVWLGQKRGDDIEALAVFGLADVLRPDAAKITEKLHAIGVKKIVMLTGDQYAVAASIARQAGIDEFRSDLLPADKVQAIRQLKEEGTVMMVGDGVNDAPALATAHLGVAMGAAGTDIAMETADIVLMGDRLDNIAILLGMARHAKRVLFQNLAFASAVIVCLVAAALGFKLPLPLGVVGHEGSTVLVCLNGLRLLGYNPRQRP